MAQFRYLAVVTLFIITAIFLCCSGCQKNPPLQPSNKGDTELLVFGAPWCPPCNREIIELDKKLSEIKAATHKYKVTVMAVEGQARGSQADDAACLRWKDRLGVSNVLFTASSWEDYKKYYEQRGNIPGVVAVDFSGKQLKVFTPGTQADELMEFLLSRIN